MRTHSDLFSACFLHLLTPINFRSYQYSLSTLTLVFLLSSSIVVPIHKGGDCSVVKNYRPVSLTSVVCKQMEHVIAGYTRQVWEDRVWLYEGQHGFRPGYLCESQIITVCQDISDSLVESTRLDAIIIGFSKAFDLVPCDRPLKKIVASGVDSRVIVWIREFLIDCSQRVK